MEPYKMAQWVRAPVLCLSLIFRTNVVALTRCPLTSTRSLATILTCAAIHRNVHKINKM